MKTAYEGDEEWMFLWRSSGAFWPFLLLSEDLSEVR